MKKIVLKPNPDYDIIVSFLTLKNVKKILRKLQILHLLMSSSEGWLPLQKPYFSLTQYRSNWTNFKAHGMQKVRLDEVMVFFDL